MKQTEEKMTASRVRPYTEEDQKRRYIKLGTSHGNSYELTFPVYYLPTEE